VLAGWCFLCGKTASCAAMALVLGAHVAPGRPVPAALTALAVCALVNHRGIRATARATAAILTVVGLGLAVAVAGGLRAWAGAAGTPPDPFADVSGGGVLEAAGFLFFALAGYARLATLGEEVRDPARTIPRAIALSLGIVLGVYALLAAALLAALGPGGTAAAARPLVDLAVAGGLGSLVPVVRLAAVAAVLGVLVALLAGVGRTAFAMAADGHLPAPLARVDPRVRAPRRATLAAAAAAAGVVLVADVRAAIALSSVLVLAYYALANASALRLPPGPGYALRLAAASGAAGCLVVAASLPPATVAAGAAVAAAGTAGILLTRRMRGGPAAAGPPGRP